jgi:hypothetical protein
VARQNVLSLLENQPLSALYNNQSKLYLPLAKGESLLWKSEGDKEHFSDQMKFLTVRDHEHLNKKIKKIYEGKSHGTWEKNWPNKTHADSKQTQKVQPTD